MEILNIFGLVKDRLYTVRYTDEEEDEFTRIFRNWDDIEYLEEFFETNKTHLNESIYAPLPIEKAVFRTVSDATVFEKKIMGAANGTSDDTLELVFQPLHKKFLKNEYTESKAYGTNNKSWLRVYGIRIAKDLYVVTGGAIKLTKSMQDAEHLKQELLKLKATQHYLKTNGISDSNDLGFFEIE